MIRTLILIAILARSIVGTGLGFSQASIAAGDGDPIIVGQIPCLLFGPGARIVELRV